MNKSKILKFDLPESLYKSFVMNCDLLDINVLSSYKEDRLLSEDSIVVIIKITEKPNEPGIQFYEDKINEKYGKFLEEDN